LLRSADETRNNAGVASCGTLCSWSYTSLFFSSQPLIFLGEFPLQTISRSAAAKAPDAAARLEKRTAIRATKPFRVRDFEADKAQEGRAAADAAARHSGCLRTYEQDVSAHMFLAGQKFVPPCKNVHRLSLTHCNTQICAALPKCAHNPLTCLEVSRNRLTF